jgi:PDDEXK-like uncharacterized protein DUF3799
MATKTKQPTGIFTLPSEAYHSDPCDQPSLSAGIAHILCSQSPLHAWTAHPKLNPDFVREEKERWDVGTAAHALLLESRSVEDVVEVVHANDWRTNAAKAARDEARAAGKIPLLERTVENVIAMLLAARQQLDAVTADPPLLGDGKPEQTLIWQEGDVTCRALADWLHDDYAAIDDFKTTSASADPDRWKRTMFTIGADIQTAFHLRGLKAVTGGAAVMRYIVQETYPPYALSVVAAGADVLAVAEAKVEWAIKRWGECLAANEWPAYPTAVCYAELPAWEEARWLEREAREEAA